MAAVAAAITDLASAVRPAVLAGERMLAVPGPLGEVLPGGGLQRGSITVIDGAAGTGATTVVLGLLAAVTQAGEWAALVDQGGRVGGLAAAEAGVVLERLGVVRDVSREQWPAVMAALIEGTAFVATAVPRHVKAADARRLAARARERSTAVVAVGAWPAEAALRLRAQGTQWQETQWQDTDGVGTGAVETVAHLGARTVRVEVEGRRHGRGAHAVLVVA